MNEAPEATPQTAEEITEAPYQRDVLIGIVGMTVGVTMIIFASLAYITIPRTRPSESIAIFMGVLVIAFMGYWMIMSCHKYGPKR